MRVLQRNHPPAPPLSDHAAAERDQWIDAVKKLVQQVSEWAQKKNWAVEEISTESYDGSLGTYALPVLQISVTKRKGNAPQEKIVLEPVAYDTRADLGRVDLYAWPTLYRVMLLREQGMEWQVRTDSGLNWPHSWSKETFFELAEGLLAAK